MLTLPIKRKWFDMIRYGEKKEEYRSMTPYYAIRFLNYAAKTKALKKMSEMGLKGMPFKDIVLRAGYRKDAPAIKISGQITVGSGRPEWGAVPGEEYYVLHIEEVEDLITDARSRNYDSGGKES